MASLKYYIILSLMLFFTCALTVRTGSADEITEWIKRYYIRESGTFAATTSRLRKAISDMDGHPASKTAARNALRDCRLQYKRISLLMDYYFASEARSFNAPAKQEVEEPYIEYTEPQGLQQIESLLWAPSPDKAALMREARLLENSAKDLYALLYQFQTNETELAECMQLEWIRIMILYPTGYDAPYLKSGIQEAAASVSGISYLLQILKGHSGKETDSLQNLLQSAASYLQTNKKFETFNRLQFIVRYGIPIQTLLAELNRGETVVDDENVHSPRIKNMRNLFSPDAIDIKLFPGASANPDSNLIALGEKLFFSPLLSANKSRSCSSCHSPQLYFTDAMTRNRSIDGSKQLPRNTMGLLYCTYQYAQFWDGRAKRLEDQILEVFHNPDELAGNDSIASAGIDADRELSSRFKEIWTETRQPVNSGNIAIAIAAYLRTLNPFHSAFDQYMMGDSMAMNQEQKKGFNLFMGKAGCGTCHFAPLFNGTTPPYFDRTEYEVLGTPALDKKQHPVADGDRGRYKIFPTSSYDAAFKIPTIRNAAKTAPYMHNGVYRNLDSVVEFYDRGGGIGLGLRVPNQTLSDKKLHLTRQEKKEIVLFMEALTDKAPANAKYRIL